MLVEPPVSASFRFGDAAESGLGRCQDTMTDSEVPITVARVKLAACWLVMALRNCEPGAYCPEITGSQMAGHGPAQPARAR